MDSGFAGSYGGGQLDNPYIYGGTGGVDPMATFGQYSNNPYSAVPASSGGSQGGGTPAPGGPVPDLRMAFADAPEYLPEKAANGQPPPNPAYATATFDAGSFRDAQNTMIASTAEVVALYKSLRSLVLSTSDWVFGQKAVTYVPPSTSHGLLDKGPDDVYKGEDPQPYAPGYWEPDPALFLDSTNNPDAFAGTPGHPGMNDAQANTLIQIADGMELVGQFLGMMQSTGIAYATADANSTPPPSEKTAG